MRKLICLLFIITGFAASAVNPVIFQKKDKFGLKDSETGKVIVKPKYDSISDFNEGYALVKKKNKVGLITATGEEYLPVKFSSILLPKYYETKGEDFFWASIDGVTYNIHSKAHYSSDGLTDVFLGPDSRWYAKNRSGRWVDIQDPKKIEYKPWGQRPPEVKKIESGHFIFDKKLFTNNNQIAIADVDSVEEREIFGVEYFVIVSAGVPVGLIDKESECLWKRKGNEFVSTCYNIPYKYVMESDKIYKLMPLKNGLFTMKHPDFDLYSLYGDGERLTPFKFKKIEVGELDGSIGHMPVNLLTLESNSVEHLSDEALPAIKKYLGKFLVINNVRNWRSILWNGEGKMLSDDFENLHIQDGLITFIEDGKEIRTDYEGNKGLYEYDSFKSMDGKEYFNNGDYLVTRGGKDGLYVKGVGELIPPLYDDIARIKGHIFVYKDGLWGLYDNYGNIIFDTKYKNFDIAGFVDGPIYYIVTHTSGQKSLVDTSGRTVLPPSNIDSFNFIIGEPGKWCKVYKNGKLGILDLSAKKVAIPCVYEDGTEQYSDGVWPNRKMAVTKLLPGGKYQIDIWTMRGNKVASQIFREGEIYRMIWFMEKQLGIKLYLL